MPLWLLGIGSFLKEAAGAALDAFRRYPWQMVCLALLGGCLWLLHSRNDARDQLAQHIAAEKAATGAQRRVNDAAQVHYERKADEADNAHADMVAEAFDSTARYVARNRVRPEDRTCKAPAPAASGDPRLHDEVPRAGVVVAEPDVQRCAAWQAYGVAAHDWALSLKLPENLLPEGTAEPNPR